MSVTDIVINSCIGAVFAVLFVRRILEERSM